MNADNWTAARAELASKFQVGCAATSKSVQIPKKPGVYILEKDGVAHYVGMSKNLRQRWIGHGADFRNYLDAPGSLLFWAEMSHPEAAFWEIILIKRLQPSLNTTGVRPPRRFKSNTKPIPTADKAPNDAERIEKARSLSVLVQETARLHFRRFLDITPNGEHKALLTQALGTSRCSVERVASGVQPLTLAYLAAIFALDRDCGLAMLNSIGEVLGVQSSERPKSAEGQRDIPKCISAAMVASTDFAGMIFSLEPKKETSPIESEAIRRQGEAALRGWQELTDAVRKQARPELRQVIG